MLTLVLVALSVGLDNFGAATALGVSGVDGRLRLRVAIIFGVFEAAMPVLGLLLGHSVAQGLGDDTKLVAGAVLCLVGGYTLISELAGGRRGSEHAPPSTKRLVVLGASLSIDNVAIGFALGTYHVSILVAAPVIALVSVALTLVGLELGSRLGARLGQRSELVGGLMLLGVGLAVATGLL
ncbi:MAG TPA: manganese efflux pump [Acidimicrobiales bacterium]|nr:manganese efflux pump [Acidimicrobiales bacterium]